MKINNLFINLSSKGNGDIIDITGQVSEMLQKSGLKSGLMTVFAPRDQRNNHDRI